jgi:trans-aconitate methyltransferase
VSERKTHWEKIYESNSPQKVSWYQDEPTLSMRLIRDTRIPNDAPIIDVGGGASTLVDRLLDASYSNISVLDISASAMLHARERLADKAAEIEWYNEDITGFNPPHRFALWHDRAVFHFLTSQDDRNKYLNVLKQSLEPGGHVIIMTFAVGGPQKCSGLEIMQYDEEKLMVEFGQEFELLETGHQDHVTPAGSEQKFAWFRLIRTF